MEVNSNTEFRNLRNELHFEVKVLLFPEKNALDINLLKHDPRNFTFKEETNGDELKS